MSSGGKTSFAETLAQSLAAAIARHRVPGATLAVLRDGAIHTAAAGALNLETGAEATPEGVFQIGSVTKSFTASLALGLVDVGRLDLDAAVIDYLPEFRLADEGTGAAARIRVRDLLCHVSGIDGDRIDDTGDDAAAVSRLVAGLAECRLLHPTGAFFSYSNVGYIVLGRIIEVLEDSPWDEVLAQRLLRPLSLDSAATRAAAVPARHLASGHETDAQGQARVSKDGFAPRSNGPSGTTLAMTATDLVRFARYHLSGAAENGERLLAPDTLRRMREMQVATPLSYRYSGWGLGWMLYDWEGLGVFGHDGGWAGQSAYLRICPQAGLAVALLANGGAAAAVFREVVAPLLAEHAGFSPPPLPEAAVPSPAPADLARYAGRYARHGQTIVLSVADGMLQGKFTGPYVDDDEGEGTPFSLGLINPRQAVCRIAGQPFPAGGYFLEFDPDGRPGYFHVTERAFRREA